MPDLVPVRIWMDPKEHVHVAPEIVRISVSHGQRVLWQCDVGDFEIQFHKDQCPFPVDRMQGPACGGVISPFAEAHSAREDFYKYTVILTTPDGRRHVKDPGVVVEG